MKKWALAGGFVVLLLGGSCWLDISISRNRAEAELKEQLRLARLEGIPTTAAEFAALIKPCRPEDNAAPYYRKLASLPRNDPDPLLAYNLTFKSDAASIKAAQKFLDSNRTQLAAIDMAVTKTRCWFNRDWSQGYAVLFSEYAYMKQAAKLLSIRASINVAEGKPDLALADIQRMQTIANHSGEEPEELGPLVADGIRIIETKTIAGWAFEHPSVPQYKAGLKSAIDNFSPPDGRKEHTEDLSNILWLFNALKTPEGRASLGLKPRDTDQRVVEGLFDALASNGKSEADVVKDCREMWVSYTLSSPKRETAIQNANDDLMKDIWCEPTAAFLFTSLQGGVPGGYWNDRHRQIWLENREKYSILYKALSAAKIPETIDTSKILSPYGKSLTYHFDGKHMTITVSGFDQDETPPKPSVLKIPSDLPKTK
ncbi:MAG TPA: hypothetical protein VGL56_16380 [Fimbriimonadaceae bacterium]|jgi:hypothetical protein